MKVIWLVYVKMALETKAWPSKGASHVAYGRRRREHRSQRSWGRSVLNSHSSGSWPGSNAKLSPPEDICQCLEIFFTVTTQGCYCHLLIRGQRCHQTFCNVQNNAPTNNKAHANCAKILKPWIQGTQGKPVMKESKSMEGRLEMKSERRWRPRPWRLL